MQNKQVRWLIYTVLVGLIPIICRFVVYYLLKGNNIELFSTTDFVAFGLVLHISNINEIEHFEDPDPNWKTIQNGTSIIFIAVYSVLFTLAILASPSESSQINPGNTKIFVMLLSFISFVISYSVFYRMSKRVGGA